MLKVLFVCINYNNEKEVKEFLENISLIDKNDEFKVLIVNNSETIKGKLKEELQNITLNYEIIIPNKNLGYLNGMFLGVKEYIKKYNLPEWIVFSNTDIEIKKFDFYNKDYQEDIWCIAPSIYSTQTNTYQNPHYKKRLTINKIRRIILINSIPYLEYFYSKLAILKSKYKKKKEEDSQEVYAAHGAFFILRKPFFEKIDLNYGAFLYSEEAFIAENIRLLNKKNFFDKEIKVIHKEHSTTSLIGTKKRGKYIKESLKYVLREFYENKKK